MPIILLAILVVLVFWVVSIYNFFVSTKTRVGAAVQEIGNQLKRQAELIPNLESSVKGYLTHEKGIFDVLPQHENFISVIKDKIIIHTTDGKDKEMKIDNGVLKVQENEAHIFLGLAEIV